MNLLRGRDVIREMLEGVGRLAQEGALPDPQRRDFRPRGDLTTQSVMTLGKVVGPAKAEAVSGICGVIANGCGEECVGNGAGRGGVRGAGAGIGEGKGLSRGGHGHGSVELVYQWNAGVGCGGGAHT